MISRRAAALVAIYDKTTATNHDKTISVNPVVAELATWYEKFRTAIDYREDEVILRSTIERILKRRTLIGGTGANIAPPLIRELIWARYFPDSSISESKIIEVASEIDLYLDLEAEINKKHRINRGLVSEWILHLLSSEIEHILKPFDSKDIMSNFMFSIFQNRVTIVDDSEETKDVQIYIAIRRAFANDDLAFLRYNLFIQYFGDLTEQKKEKVAEQFPEALKKIEAQFKHPARDRIYTYIKNQSIPFLILDEVFRNNRGKVAELVADEENLGSAILAVCNAKYQSIRAKVQRAIIRSVIFIFFTKAIFALFVEGAFERLLYGRTIWSSIAINTLTPPILMVLVGFLIQTPGRANSFRILAKIKTILKDEQPNLDAAISISKKSRTDPLLWILFITLWLFTFGISLMAVIFVLNKLAVNPLSQAVFLFFLAIVSFISFRINRTAHMYILKDKKENFGSVLFNFFFLPFIQIGKRLTVAIAQINILLVLFDFIIETPFKGIFAFFEQWFGFLQSQREKLD